MSLRSYIDRKGNVRYEFDFYTHGRAGERIRGRFDVGTTQDEAQEKYASYVASYKQTTIEPLRLGLTIDQLTEKYLLWYEVHWAASTYKDVKQVFEGHVSTILGGIMAELLGPQHILNYQRKRREQNVSNRTINKELAYLSGCLRWAALPENAHITPRLWKMGRLPYVRPTPNVLSIGEINRILEAAEPFYRAYLLCLYSLGLRINEARQIQWGMIDKENMCITVKQKGGSFKRLPLGPALLSALNVIASQRTGHSRTDYVFLNERMITETLPRGKPVFDIRAAIKRACKKAKIERHVNPHLFRHSMATYLLGKNVNLRTIQSMLGHKQVSSTEFYTHVLSSHLQGATDVMSEGLSTNK